MNADKLHDLITTLDELKYENEVSDNGILIFHVVSPCR